MKKLLTFLFLISSCTQQSDYKVLQVNYIQDGEQKYLFLNVKESNPYEFKVISQEGITDKPDFIITDIFEY